MQIGGKYQIGKDNREVANKMNANKDTDIIGLEDQEKLTRFQEFLLDARIDYERRRRNVVRDYEFARWLGVSVNSLSAWMKGLRYPSYDNSIKVSRKLGKEVFYILGYPPVTIAYSSELVFICDRWERMSSESKQQIIGHIADETGDTPP